MQSATMEAPPASQRAVNTTAEPVRLLTPRQAAELLGMSIQTLAKWRCLRSDGPVFCRVGSAIRYPSDLLTDFVSRLPRRTSTSDTT